MSRLGSARAEEVLSRIVGLFPRWKPTPEQRSALKERFEATTLELDQMLAIVQACYLESKGGFPPIDRITSRMGAALQQGAVKQSVQHWQAEAHAAPDTSTHKYPNEWCYLHKSERSDWYVGLSDWARQMVDAKAALWEATLLGQQGLPHRGPVEAMKREKDQQRGRAPEELSHVLRDAVVRM